MMGNENIANDHTQKISWKTKFSVHVYKETIDSLGELGNTSAYGVFWA